jgi:hypothetical protein
MRAASLAEGFGDTSAIRAVNYNLHQIKVIITVDSAFLITRQSDFRALI